ncbi:fibrinogen C domain-containing protein 1-like [Anopheles darlingi]|uniref:fibrinogen C domain-containing protein 1-like n=1 Tax=Anopheles darlingi TaxID=43151 RepID=UPI00210030BD|nr:fibrinogen C domain-containing protein 1-like [Anopheles darlingi]
MKLGVCFLVLSGAICASADITSANQTDSVDVAAPGITDNVLEVLLNKLENLQHKFLELQYELHEQQEAVAQSQATQERTYGDLLWAMQRLDRRLNLLELDIGRNLSVVQERSFQILTQQTACANRDKLREQLFDYTPKLSQGSHTPATKPEPLAPFSSCKDVRSNISGIYLIRVNSKTEPFPVYCEQQQFDGGWLVIQHRYDGSLDFNRNWTEYRDGFGEIKKEFWIGLERLHQLTTASSGQWELIVELKDFRATYKYARYNAFKISGENDQYRLKTLGKYSGTAGDSMANHKGMKFSTPDQDNDESTLHCAEKWESAWWYNGCYYANLNGRYLNDNDGKSMNCVLTAAQSVSYPLSNITNHQNGSDAGEQHQHKRSRMMIGPEKPPQQPASAAPAGATINATYSPANQHRITSNVTRSSKRIESIFRNVELMAESYWRSRERLFGPKPITVEALEGGGV